MLSSDVSDVARFIDFSYDDDNAPFSKEFCKLISGHHLTAINYLNSDTSLKSVGKCSIRVFHVYNLQF